MSVLMIFRFLTLAVRSSSRCSSGTPQPKIAASGSVFLMATFWVYSRQGRAWRVLFTLDELPNKTNLAVVGGGAKRYLPPAR